MMCEVLTTPTRKSFKCSSMERYEAAFARPDDEPRVNASTSQSNIMTVNVRMTDTVWLYVRGEINIPIARRAKPYRTIPRYAEKIGPLAGSEKVNSTTIWSSVVAMSMR